MHSVYWDHFILKKKHIIEYDFEPNNGLYYNITNLSVYVSFLQEKTPFHSGEALRFCQRLWCWSKWYIHINIHSNSTKLWCCIDLEYGKSTITSYKISDRDEEAEHLIHSQKNNIVIVLKYRTLVIIRQSYSKKRV